MIFLRQWRVVPLTPTFSCVATACEGADRRNLYAAFAGALRLLNRIDQDANSLVTAPPAIELENYRFPYISAVPKYGVANEEIQFQIIEHHHSQSDHCLIYVAETTPDRETILLKFTRRYSIELHEFCALRQHAPRIVGFRSLPGGWLVIAMQYLSSYVSPSQGDPTILDRFCEKWINDLQNLTQAFHKSNLVHGDLREPNVLCNWCYSILIGVEKSGRCIIQMHRSVPS